MAEPIVAPTDVPGSLETATPVAAPQDAPDEAALVEADLLVEDVSIDGMCGVY